MSRPVNHFYEFDNFRMDLVKRRLLRDGEIVPLAPKVFDTLLALVEQNGQLVEKDELMQKVWHDVVVEENNLTQNISALRKILGADNNNGHYIVTVPRLGYRFDAEVREVWLEDVELIAKEHTKAHIVVEKITEQSEDEQLASLNSLAARAECETPHAVSALVSRRIEAETVARTFLSRLKQRKGIALMALALFVIASVGGKFAWQWFRNASQADKKSIAAFHLSNITRLTLSGNTSGATISPDGKYIVYVLRDAEKRLGMHLLHIATGSSQEILSPIAVRHLGGLIFSPNGDHIYFVESDKFGLLQMLYRISVLGGTSAKVITDLYSYTLSPDGTRLAFVRNSRSADESVLMIANVDGSGEYRLATRKLSEPFYLLNWSPDGKMIACSAGSPEVSGKRMYPIEVRVADGTEREITTQRWNYLEQILWLADGSGLLAAGRDKSAMSNPLWYISYRSGEVQKLTDDSQIYSTISLTADSKTLVAQKMEFQTNTWITRIGEESVSPVEQARQITVGNDGYQVSYLPDGRLFFRALNNRFQYDIWVMNADGTGRKRLTENSGTNVEPVASMDGRYVVFESDRAGKINIWRMDTDGDNAKQLTFGDGEKSPTISPDGKWVVYTSVGDPRLWRVPMDGGESQPITGRHWQRAAISPDGKWILAIYKEPEADGQSRFGILPFNGGEPVRLFDIPQDIYPVLGGVWSPDGQSFIYAGTRKGIANIWKQPLKGGKLIQLTDFKVSDVIYWPHWSLDGKEIVFSRGDWYSDIFLIRDFR